MAFSVYTEDVTRITSLPDGPWKKAEWSSTVRKRTEIRYSGFMRINDELKSRIQDKYDRVMKAKTIEDLKLIF